MTGCIIQARMTSTRLPGKIKMTLNNKPLLEHLINRVRLVEGIDKIILACPHSPECCLNEEIFIGSEHDVLDRFYQASKKYNLTTIIRICGDSPVVPPYEVWRCLSRYNATITDYLTNVGAVDRFGVPDGWDVEVFSFRALDMAWNNAIKQDEREHVTLWMKDKPFLNPQFIGPPKLSVDTEQDLEAVRKFTEYEKGAYYGLE